MTQYTTTVPCTITYTHNPAEKESATEPAVQEEYILTDVRLANINVLDFLLIDEDYEKLSGVLYEYLKGKNDD